MTTGFTSAASAVLLVAACRAVPVPPPAAQNPSPMVERTRAHGRLARREVPGRRDTLAGILPRPVELFIPAASDTARQAPLLVHFLGPSFIPIEAAGRVDPRMLVLTVNLTAGSGAYEQPFRGTQAWSRLLAMVDSSWRARHPGAAAPGPVYLSAFSAGNGAVRAILADDDAAARIAGVVILDGIHTGYDPPRRVVADSGRLDPANLQSLLRYARRAVAGEVRMVVTHSEVFPGTFASTTETADWLLGAMALPRTPVLAWGPHGMQQTSEVRAGGLTLMGFAGNSAPDHLDHLHGLPWWLGRATGGPAAGGA